MQGRKQTFQFWKTTECGDAEWREDDHVPRVWLDFWADSRLRRRLFNAASAGMRFHRRCSSANGAGPHAMLASQQRSLPQCNNLLFCPTSCRCSCPAASDPDGGRAAWSSTSRQSAETCDKTSASRDSSTEAVAVLRGGGFTLWLRCILTCNGCQGLGSATLKVWQLVDAKYWIIYGGTNKFQATVDSGAEWFSMGSWSGNLGW